MCRRQSLFRYRFYALIRARLLSNRLGGSKSALDCLCYRIHNNPGIVAQSAVLCIE
jgi:hypothetical protein